MPKSKEVEVASDDFAEKKRVVFAWPDDVLIEVAHVKRFEFDFRAQGFPHTLEEFRRFLEFGSIRGRERKGKLLRHLFLGEFSDTAFGIFFPPRFIENFLRSVEALSHRLGGLRACAGAKKERRDRTVDRKPVPEQHFFNKRFLIGREFKSLSDGAVGENRRLILVEENAENARKRRAFYTNV